MGVGVTTGTVNTGIVFTGGPAMAKRLSILQKAFPVLFSEALAEEADELLDEVKDKYVPVDSGDLHDSGETITLPLTGGSYQTNVQFGRTGAQAYAGAVHEHHSKHSPPSWQHLGRHDINWTKKIGTVGAKYLERPIKTARKKMPLKIAMKVKSRMPFIPGAFTIP